MTTFHVWMNVETGELHVALFDAGYVAMLEFLDPEAIDRAMDTAEPPMLKDTSYSYIGEL